MSRHGCGHREARCRRFARAALPHLDRIYAIALRMTGCQAEAEEAVLETYTRAFYAFVKRRPPEPLRTWLDAILLQVVAERELMRCEMSTTDEHKRERLRDIEADLGTLRRNLIPPPADAHDYIDSAQDLNAREEIGGMIETLENERARLRAQLGLSDT